MRLPIKPVAEWTKADLTSELLRVQEIGSLALPRASDYPKLPNIDYFAAMEPYSGCVGGDHLLIVNFEKYAIRDRIRTAQLSGDHQLAAELAKNLDTFGILIADVAGHSIADTMTVSWLHSGFVTGASYEIEYKGRITPDLFARLNESVYLRNEPDYVTTKPYVTLLYGEISNNGRFRYLLAGHPRPIVFSSRYDRIVELDDELARASTPLGILPSRYWADTGPYELPENEIQLLGDGDIMVLHTDGLREQRNGERDFCSDRLQHVLREVKSEPSRTVCEALREELFAFCPPQDDLTLVVIKKV